MSKRKTFFVIFMVSILILIASCSLLVSCEIKADMKFGGLIEIKIKNMAELNEKFYFEPIPKLSKSDSVTNIIAFVTEEHKHTYYNGNGEKAHASLIKWNDLFEGVNITVSCKQSLFKEDSERYIPIENDEYEIYKVKKYNAYVYKYLYIDEYLYIIEVDNKDTLSNADEICIEYISMLNQ